MKKPYLLGILISLSLFGVQHLEAREIPRDKVVTVVGTIDSMDFGHIVLDVRGTRLKVSRGLFRKDMDFRPGQRIAIALPLSQVKKAVIR